VKYYHYVYSNNRIFNSDAFASFADFHQQHTKRCGFIISAIIADSLSSADRILHKDSY